jgi:regulator of replication initiation timing
MFMEAYTMSAQAQQFFPLSALFNILNLDGKDKILPVIRENEHYQEQMQQLQQQVEQMSQQMEQMQAENQNLRKTTTQMTNALAEVGANSGSGYVPQQGQMQSAQAGGGPESMNSVVSAARNMMGVPTGAQLPV